MAKKRPSFTKRLRERSRRERKEDKARRKAERRAAKDSPPETESLDDVSGTGAEEPAQDRQVESDAMGQEPVSGSGSHDSGAGDEQRSP